MYNRKAGIILPIIVVLLLSGNALRAQGVAQGEVLHDSQENAQGVAQGKDKVRDEGQDMPVDTLDEVVVAADRIREIVPAQRLSDGSFKA